MVSPFDLSGKVALITGATRGIGLAVAEAFGQAGAAVVISSESPRDCARAEAAMRAAGLDALGLACDVSSEEQIAALVTGTVHAHGKIDVLVCNAGVAPHMGPIATAGEKDWELTMTVNLRSLLWLTARVIPQMAQRGDGVVLIISSLSGLRGNKSIGLYGLSKAAAAQLARNLAVEWGPSNVRVNAISPGLIRTEFARPLLDDPQVLERRLQATPLRRVGEPWEVAGAALFLASRAGSFVTGHNLVVDGGTLISDGN
jgi:NAD(P)-dependent dehydrogenase (short-subunit alcohol dehydrogenase family)